MSSPLPDLDALPHDGLKRLVAQLLGRVSVLEEENRQLRDENARLKDLPKRPQLAPGGMDRASGPDQQAATKAARRLRRKARRGKRTPPATEERTLTVTAPPGSRRKGYECYTVQDLVLLPQVIRYRRERWLTPDGGEMVAPLPRSRPSMGCKLDGRLGWPSFRRPWVEVLYCQARRQGW